jgi:peptidoglycan/LPS O-acetylase OafA/YrhL
MTAKPPRAKTAPKPDDRRNNFDFVRLAAALSVLFSHSFLIAEGTTANEPLVRLSGNQAVLGLLGVFVFFAISGYLITESYCRAPALAGFALRRALRIFPGLVVNTLICALVLGPLVTTLPLSAYFGDHAVGSFIFRMIALNPSVPPLPGVVFVDNPVGLIVNGSLWTLRPEAMMYVMVALLGVCRLLRLGVAALLVFVGIASVCFEQYVKPLGELGGWAWMVGFFAAGMCLYFLRDRIPFNRWGALLAITALIGFTAIGRLIMLFPLAGAYLAIYAGRRYDRRLDYSKYFGDLSYGIYIYGWPIEDLVIYLSGGRASWWQVLLGALSITLPLAFLSWHLIEQPALLWGRWLSRRWTNTATGWLAPSALRIAGSFASIRRR